jgi:hypothetical protein
MGGKWTLRVSVAQLNQCNIDRLLALVPGKELLAKLAPKVGCVDANAVARAARHHLSTEEFPMLSELASTITAMFDRGANLTRAEFG